MCQKILPKFEADEFWWFFKIIIFLLPAIFIKVFPQVKDTWEWLLKYYKVGSVFSFFFFLPGFRSKLALKVHTSTVCVGNRFLMLFTWFWEIIPTNLKAPPALARQAGCGLTASKVWGVLLKNKICDLHIRQTGLAPCLGELSKDDWISSVWTQIWFDKLAQVHHCLNLYLCSFSLNSDTFWCVHFFLYSLHDRRCSVLKRCFVLFPTVSLLVISPFRRTLVSDNHQNHLCHKTVCKTRALKAGSTIGS